MDALNIAALLVFGVCWLFYQPALAWLSRRGGAINSDLMVIRAAWMHNMARRENRFMDNQILGYALSSSTFFASSNLLLIGGAASALFNGAATFRHISSLEVIRTSSQVLFEGQLGLIILTLARGMLDFIWAIRQMNYTLAAVGSAPEDLDEAGQKLFGDLVARILNPALSSFSAGVRGYYFALAAAAWLFGPIPFIVASLSAVTILLWRQRASPSAYAIADLRRALEQHRHPPNIPRRRGPSSP